MILVLSQAVFITECWNQFQTVRILGSIPNIVRMNKALWSLTEHSERLKKWNFHARKKIDYIQGWISNAITVKLPLTSCKKILALECLISRVLVSGVSLSVWLSEASFRLTLDRRLINPIHEMFLYLKT